MADLTSARRSALDRMADLPEVDPRAPSFAEVKLDANGASVASDDLVRRISRNLVRESPFKGPGAVLVTGLAWDLDQMEARRLHEEMFCRVWTAFQHGAGHLDGLFSIKTKVIRDGKIPVEHYGSPWSFKSLHVDRDALLFSHRYGPLSGFSGGEMLVADVRSFLRRHRLRFNDVLQWSDEPTEGSKPVLRSDYHDAVMAECGMNLGVIGPAEVLFVNNLPEAGIFHGVTPVEVTDPVTFVREYHRVRVKRR